MSGSSQSKRSDNLIVLAEPLPAGPSTCAAEGQYYQDHTSTVYYFNASDNTESTPGNVGGFHWCVIDTHAPNSDWILCTQVTDTMLLRDGSLHDMGARTKWAALVQKDYADFLASPLKHEDECRALVKVAEIRLPSGRVCIGASDLDLNMMPHAFECQCGAGAPLHIPTGHGDGFYPVEVHKNGNVVKRLNMNFIE